MSKIHPKTSSNFHTTINKVPDSRKHCKELKAEPSDQFIKNVTVSETPGLNRISKFYNSGNAKKAAKVKTHFSPEPYLSENSAGWKTSMKSGIDANSFFKVPLKKQGSVLVVPIKNDKADKWGKSVIINSREGVEDLPDVLPPGYAKNIGYSQTTGGNRTFIYNKFSTEVMEYDENLSRMNSFDLKTMVPDGEVVNGFLAGSKGCYALVGKDNQENTLVAFDPKTGEKMWSKDYGYASLKDFKEGPDGNIYLSMQLYFDRNAIMVFSPRGKKLREFGVEKPGEFEFAGIGKALICEDGELQAVSLRRKSPLRSKKVGARQFWSIDGDFHNLRISSDGNHAFAIDRMMVPGRRHSLCKIDLKTGKKVWQRDKYDENFIDYREINGKIHLVTSNSDGSETRMTILDENGKETWQDTAKVSLDEKDTGTGNVVTPDGNFILGDKNDGTVYFLRPRQPGDTKEQIEQEISIEQRYMKESLNELESETGEISHEKQVEDQGSYIIIGGVKLRKNIN